MNHQPKQQKGIKTMENTQAETPKVAEEETEEAERCRDCDSTEAGNCFYCKMD